MTILKTLFVEGYLDVHFEDEVFVQIPVLLTSSPQHKQRVTTVLFSGVYFTGFGCLYMRKC